MNDPEAAAGIAEWAGTSLPPGSLDRFDLYAGWLAGEAIPAGGLGPREGERLWPRHLADSLAFACGWRGRRPPGELLDVGSGVGLPGIPLALLWPECRVTLLDRGGRRIRLLRRIVRILALQNVVIAQGDIFDVGDEWEALVFRGSVPAAEAVGLSKRLLMAGGTAVVGLSRRSERPERADDLANLSSALGLTGHIEQVPAKLLDGTAWLLIMTAGEPLP